jgi:hypothetical protein
MPPGAVEELGPAWRGELAHLEAEKVLSKRATGSASAQSMVTPTGLIPAQLIPTVPSRADKAWATPFSTAS